jgi:hypothetical protein
MCLENCRFRPRRGVGESLGFTKKVGIRIHQPAEKKGLERGYHDLLLSIHY